MISHLGTFDWEAFTRQQQPRTACGITASSVSFPGCLSPLTNVEGLLVLEIIPVCHFYQTCHIVIVASS